MKKSVYLLGFLSAFLLSMGIFFKMMHWPTANIQIGIGFVFLNFGFLPAWFLVNYKTTA